MNFGRQRCAPRSTEDVVRSISIEFPKVSPRIIADVLSAYCSRGTTVTEAADATRRRLRDATAV